MSSKLPYKQAANVERRTWDKQTYEARAKARIAAEQSSSSNNDADVQNYGPSSSSVRTNTGENGEKNGNKKDIESSLNTDVDSHDNKEEFRSAQAGSHGPMNSKRAFLQARREKVDLEGKVGTSEMINPDAAATSSMNILDSNNDNDNNGEACVSITDGVTKSVGGVGWHCKVCDCFLKDSLTYLDHINGRKHQRALGYSMRIAKSTTKEVVSRLDQLAEEQKQKMVNEGIIRDSSRLSDDGNGNEFEEVVKKKDQEIEQRKADRKRRREERKRRIRQEKEGKGGVPELQVAQDQVVQIVHVQQGGDDKAEEKEEEEVAEDDGMDPDFAAMMGFSGFK